MSIFIQQQKNNLKNEWKTESILKEHINLINRVLYSLRINMIFFLQKNKMVLLTSILRLLIKKTLRKNIFIEKFKYFNFQYIECMIFLDKHVISCYKQFF